MNRLNDSELGKYENDIIKAFNKDELHSIENEKEEMELASGKLKI